MLYTPQIDYSSREPHYLQIYEQIKQQIISGTFSEQVKLPSIRKLADSLGLSTTPVETAYQQLLAEGFIASKPKSGYYVQSLAETDGGNHGDPATRDLTVARLEHRDNATYPYDFHLSKNDFSLFPFSLWRRLFHRVLCYEQRHRLFYGDPQGEPGLRQELASYLRQLRGVVCSPEQIVIGADQYGLLSLLTQLLRGRVTRVGTENPGYPMMASTFRRNGYEVVPISLEADGLSIEQVEKSDVQLVCVTPSHQYPCGMIMPIAKRLRLLDWAMRTDSYIIEDDYDGEFRYHGRPVPSLQGLKPDANVIYMGGFSQVLAPAFCVYYMVLPESLLESYDLLLRDLLLEQPSSPLHQHTLQLFMQEGHFERHVRRMRNTYRKKHDAVVLAVQKHMGEKAELIGENAGFHLVLRVKHPQGECELTRRAKQAGIKLSSMAYTWMTPRDEKAQAEFILGFAGIDLDKIEPGIKKLAEVWWGEMDFSSNLDG
ncbi:PLP-dependent aminotransferase family protein [Brevibacillus ruminantium]|uniref:PLP-dependent aminotransferase family protein n=1 Tax=Brevibacillus ruminantium TaxID=2950604 RepID=A0ABY4WCR1_9BACL|nr:PLP-dependent aminotransferase family protein [Brevibacillus ruminantium]USG64963.1 PLP-dependent aminotransferase family protein [Brevibacillus ruminantium]